MQQQQAERVSRAEAARRLSVDRATVTRLVQSHPSLLDDAGLVNPEEIEALRRGTVNPALATKSRQPDPTLNDMRQRTETARTAVVELDLADRLGMTLQRADVERQVMAAGQAFNQACAHMSRDRAEALALIGDVREMERALDALFTDLREQLAQALTLATATPGAAQSS